jgi:hypothetical protein
MIWLIINLVVYRIGLWTTGWYHPYPLLGNLMEGLNVSALIADGIVAVTSAYLFTGGIVMFWLELNLARTAKFQKMSCPSCGGHIKFAIQNLGQKIPCPHCHKETTLRKPDLLKMSCFFCKEHIEFPVHAIGQKIACPHCKMDITLKESV